MTQSSEEEDSDEEEDDVSDNGNGYLSNHSKPLLIDDDYDT